MTNVAVAAVHGESKHQMSIEITDNPAVTPINADAMALGVREHDIVFGHLNQVSFHNFLNLVICQLRDGNFLDDLSAFPNGLMISGPINTHGRPNLLIENISVDRIWFPNIDVGHGFVLLPVESQADWLANGFTNELTNIGTRMIEKIREDWLITI